MYKEDLKIQAVLQKLFHKDDIAYDNTNFYFTVKNISSFIHSEANNRIMIYPYKNAISTLMIVILSQSNNIIITDIDLNNKIPWVELQIIDKNIII